MRILPPLPSRNKCVPTSISLYIILVNVLYAHNVVSYKRKNGHLNLEKRAHETGLVLKTDTPEPSADKVHELPGSTTGVPLIRIFLLRVDGPGIHRP